MTERRYITKRDHLQLLERIRETEKRLREKQSQVDDTSSVGGNAWHDNAGYDNLVIEIRGINERLNKLHTALNSLIVAEAPTSVEKVVIGVDVVLEINGGQESWSIVGYDSGDIDENRLAYNTPLAKAILGLRVGDTTKVHRGGHLVSIKIVKISISKEICPVEGS